MMCHVNTYNSNEGGGSTRRTEIRNGLQKVQQQRKRTTQSRHETEGEKRGGEVVHLKQYKLYQKQTYIFCPFTFASHTVKHILHS